MKYNILKRLLVLVAFFTMATACEDLTDVNMNPNAVDGESINPKYVFSSILANSPIAYTREFAYGESTGLAEATQYLQRDYIGFEINNFIWTEESWNETKYKPIKDSDYLYRKAEEEENEDYRRFYQATALIMKSFYYGFFTSVWGDMPFSEAMQAENGLFTPKYDNQKEIFQTVIADLKTANDLLAGLGVVGGLESSDIIYGADALKWQKFANSLRLRYYMRLSEKISDSGIDVVGEFAQIVNNPDQFPIFTGVSDNASIAYAGTNEANSWNGGPLGRPNRSEFYRRKPAATIVRTLREAGDPRLTTWIRPADAQILVRNSDAEYGIGADGRVKRYISSYQEGVDTFLYVGLEIAMREPDSWNLRPSANYDAIRTLNPDLYLDQGANPHTSYLADIYAENAHPLVKSILMTYSEVNFLLAEAAHKDWISTGNAEDYYIAGIQASLDQYQIADGSLSVYNTTNHGLDAFDENSFLGNLRDKFSGSTGEDQFLQIMEQKWIALWMTPEGWLNWRRTGLPDLSQNIQSGTNGDKIPVRFIYGINEMNLNGDNVMEAISRLTPAENTQWSKMWLIEGTGKPW